MKCFSGPWICQTTSVLLFLHPIFTVKVCKSRGSFGTRNELREAELLAPPHPHQSLLYGWKRKGKGKWISGVRREPQGKRRGKTQRGLEKEEASTWVRMWVKPEEKQSRMDRAGGEEEEAWRSAWFMAQRRQERHLPLTWVLHLV